MGVRLRLQRQGRCNRPHFRIVATDSHVKQKGKCLEVLGFLDPLAKGEEGVKVDLERAQHWVSRGAQCSSAVAGLLKRKGFKFPVKARSPKAQRKGKETPERKKGPAKA